MVNQTRLEVFGSQTGYSRSGEKAYHVDETCLIRVWSRCNELGFSLDIVHKNLPLSVRFPWEVSIVSFAAYPETIQGRGDVVGSVEKILGDVFFDGVEVSVVSESAWSQIRPLLRRKWIARGCQPDILINKLDLNSSNSSARTEAINRIKLEIEKAGERGMGAVGVCSGPDPGQGRREDAKNLLAQSLVELCKRASQYNMNVVLESFDRTYDKKLLIGPLEEAIEVIEKVRSTCRNIGLMWDLSHAPMLDEKPEELKKAKGWLMHVHIGCAKKVDNTFKDTHPGFHTKGAVNTEDDIARLLKILWEIDYRGRIGFEVKPEEHQTSQEIVNCAKGVLMKAYQNVAMDILEPRRP